MTAIASSIAHIDHLAVFETLLEQRSDDFPVEAVMTYMMQTLEESAMPTMAFDLNVSGLGGYSQATTEQEKRDILFAAIKTRKLVGTVGALKDAIVNLGYSSPTVLEGQDNLYYSYNGSIYFSGAITYSGGSNGWAYFTVILPELELTPLSADQISELVAYINHWKNVRSRLVGVGYYAAVDLLYDGNFYFDGQANYDGKPTETTIFVT